MGCIEGPLGGGSPGRRLLVGVPWMGSLRVIPLVGVLWRGSMSGFPWRGVHWLGLHGGVPRSGPLDVFPWRCSTRCPLDFVP
jgi:hypothetical protein